MQFDGWVDISCESEREYLYADHSLKIPWPLRLRVTQAAGGKAAHRIVAAGGQAYFIAPGWQAIRWQVKDGQPLFHN